MLTIAVSSRALFHMEDSHDIFLEKGQAAFDAYMREKEDTPLRPGAAFPLMKKFLALNNLAPEPVVKVILLSRNSAEAGNRVMNSIQHYGLSIEGAVFCEGDDRFGYAKALGALLFLSTNGSDVKLALANGIAAATMRPADCGSADCDDRINLAFDGDSVLFSDESDKIYRKLGLNAFRDHEVDNRSLPLGDGPFRKFFEALHVVQQSLPRDQSPIRLMLLTARGMPAHARVIHTLRSWGVMPNHTVFAGGAPKGPILEAFGAHMFFDDTMKNIDSALQSSITSGHVPHGEGGIVHEALAIATPPALDAV